jgi:hypothetical protein
MQLNAHIDNVKAIAKRLPFYSVVNHIYSKLLGQWVSLNTGSTNSDQLKMIGAIHRVISSNISYDAIAAAMLMLMVKVEAVDSHAKSSQRRERDHLTTKLRRFIRELATHLGSSFEGNLLVDALLSFQVSSASWSYQDEEDKARLMFQCVTLSVSSLPTSDIQSLHETLCTARKKLLTWCCSEYGPYFSSKSQLKRLDYFHSGLGSLEKHDGKNTFPPWLKIMRCVLFLETPDSPHMKRFWLPMENSNEDASDWEQELSRIKLCFKYGGDLQSDMLWIVLKSASIANGIDAEMAIQILEHLLEKCGQSEQAVLTVNDPNIVWELYNLVLYTPDAEIMKPSSYVVNKPGTDPLAVNEKIR